jgi:hypothetical protein
MWGKLTERWGQAKSRIISDTQELYCFLTKLGIQVRSLLFVSDDVVWAALHYSNDEIFPNLGHTNEVIGAYVKSRARLRLYAYLNSLQGRELYCDTESVFYIQKDRETSLIEYADSLGSMVNELKPGHYITEFVSAGAKNYGYKILNSVTGQCETVCKVRGIRLNYSAKHLVNFDIITWYLTRGVCTTLSPYTWTRR